MILKATKEIPQKNHQVGTKVRALRLLEHAQAFLAHHTPPALRSAWMKSAPIRGDWLRWSERPMAFGVLFASLSTVVFFAQAPIVTFVDSLLARTPSLADNRDEHDPTLTQYSDTSAERAAAGIAQPIGPELSAYRLKRGEGFVDFLIRAGVARKEAYRWALRLDDHIDMRRLPVGARFDLAIAEQSLIALDHRISFDETVEVRLKDGEREIKRVKHPTNRHMKAASGTISSSLYKAAAEAGLSDGMISAVADVLAFDVDFQRDLRLGDEFTLYYDEYSVTGLESDDPRSLLRDGKPLYLEITVNGEPVEALWYEADGIKPGYFAKDGRSTRKALMKTPIDGARLSGVFGKRLHPVLGYTRMHKGLDFAAPRGTPIKAAGDGVIDFLGRNGGFGNFVRIRHGGVYMTGYAHLTRFAKGLKKGSKVSQGQVIGTLGSTGLATGPHLHYEVYKNGKQVDPRRLKLPEAQRLTGPALQEFATYRATLLTQVQASLSGKRYAAAINTPETGTFAEDTPPADD